MHHLPRTVATTVVGREAKDAEKVQHQSSRGWPLLGSQEKKILRPVGDLIQRRWATGQKKRNVIEVVLNAKRSLFAWPALAAMCTLLIERRRPTLLHATPLIERRTPSLHGY